LLPTNISSSERLLGPVRTPCFCIWPHRKKEWLAALSWIQSRINPFTRRGISRRCLGAYKLARRTTIDHTRAIIYTNQTIGTIVY
jgi:hypothetical protein